MDLNLRQSAPARVPDTHPCIQNTGHLLLSSKIKPSHAAMEPAALMRESWRTQLENSQSTELVAGVLNEPAEKLRLESPNETQTDLHGASASNESSMLNPPKIYDLPDEILMAIFRHLRKCDDIKRLRLSCQRLNKTSSHLLINTLHVSPNPKSLERLDQVACHPTISRGVRRLVASVDVYDPDLAGNMRTFASRCIEELLEFDFVHRSCPERFEARKILESWLEFIDTFPASSEVGAHLDVCHISAVYNGWLEYRQLHSEQQTVLGNGRYPKDIASAIGKMACLDVLAIRDRSYSSADENAGMNDRLRSLVRNPTRLVEEMMLYTFSWQDAKIRHLADPPTDLLYEIPLAIHRAGSSLAHLRLDLTPPRSFRLQFCSSEKSQLESFAQNLKSFKLSVGAEKPTWWNQPGAHRDTEEIENFERFLAVFASPDKLETLSLDLAFRERDCLRANRSHDPNRTSIGPLLFDWHKHQNIHLKNCSITLEELQTFVSLPRKKPAVLGLWYVYLLDGTWAEAVEILRSEVLSGRLSKESVGNLLAFFLPPRNLFFYSIVPFYKKSCYAAPTYTTAMCATSSFEIHSSGTTSHRIPSCGKPSIVSPNSVSFLVWHF